VRGTVFSNAPIECIHNIFVVWWLIKSRSVSQTKGWFSIWRIWIDLRKISHRLIQSLSRRMPRETEENLAKPVRIGGIQVQTLSERYSVTEYTNLLSSPPKYMWDTWNDTRNSINEDSANHDTPPPHHVSGSLQYWQEATTDHYPKSSANKREPFALD